MIYFFDLDGTLIDSTKRHYLLMKKILKQYNIRIPSDFDSEFIKYKSDGHSGKMYLINKLGIYSKQAQEIQNIWISHIEDENWLKYDKLYDDTKDVLKKLFGKKVYYLTSRKNYQGTINEIWKLGLDKYCEKCIVVEPQKTYNAKASVLKNYNNRYHEECIMIGDTEIDYNAAIECNMQYYILNRGFRTKRFWDNKGVVSYLDFGYLKVRGDL